ncbi:outer membrane protein [Bradyrhizobium sp.]|uniref:outer membrane protein n=1 Tax=Bradyrhizobium sp. TaxID=376 RepID=UPI002D62EA66|nr:outer membrane protein [Bradyrhizobium sp.]HZR72792.1 outer membrane protein [Bradyrhizobium sp.]
MKRVALGLLLASVAGSAYAADLPAPPAVPYTKAPAIVSPATNWSGFYIGAMGGYGSENSGDQFAIKGGFGGGTVGYNWQFGQFVVGLEGDGAFADINNSVTQVFPVVGAVTASAKVDALATIRGRFGVAFDQVLLYGTAGLALADTKLSASALGLTVSDSQTLTGWTAGAGIEWMFLPHWSVKGEYLYRSFGSQTFFASTVPGGISTGTLNINSGQVGINYHF